MQVEWDPAKAKTNLKKHGVTFEEATSAFAEPFSITVPDVRHSQQEQRYFLLGVSDKERLVVVFHTDRSGNVRIISARKATRQERKAYEET